MIYPKFPRRTLALILLCLVITLGAVGIIFLVYFFNEGSALLLDSPLKTVYNDQKQSQQYKQNLISNGDYVFEQKPSNTHTKLVEGNLNQLRNHVNVSSILQTSDIDLPILSSFSTQEFDGNPERQALLLTKTLNSKSSKDSNLDTIYIDDFDKPTYNSKSKSEPSNIDYFDTILVDHKNENNIDRKLNSLRLQEADSMRSIIYQNKLISAASSINLKNTNENERKSRVNSKRRDNGSRWNKTKLFRYTKVTQNTGDDDDAYDLETDTTGSGSGDFIDDTEINEIFIKHITTKMKKESSLIKAIRKNNIKNGRLRKKHRNHFYNDDNELIPSPPLLTTLSSGDDRSINSWVNHKSFNKLHPTMPSQTTEQIHSSSIKISQSFHESTNKKRPLPELVTNHQKSLIAGNESDNYSGNLPTSSYNNNYQSQVELGELSSTATARVIESSASNLREIGASENNEAWIETRTRRIMGNVKKSEERSRQLLLCEEAGGGELCRMLFKGHIND